MKRTFNRRKFLKQFVLVCTSAPILSSCDFSFRPSVDEITTQLIKLLRHHPSASWLGKIYSQTYQELNSLTIEELTKEILARIDLKMEEVSNSDLQNLKKLIATQIREDFAIGNVVAVDGWLLSETEADLCALVFKLQNS